MPDKNVIPHQCIPMRNDTSIVSRGVTSACDDDINLANDLVQLDHPESVHAVCTQEREEVQLSASARTVTNRKIYIIY